MRVQYPDCTAEQSGVELLVPGSSLEDGHLLPDQFEAFVSQEGPTLASVTPPSTAEIAPRLRHPTTTEDTPTLLSREYSRRMFGRIICKVVAGAAAIRVGLQADTVTSEMINTTEPSLHEIDTSSQEFLRSATFLIPGFNVLDSRQTAEVYRPTMRHYGGLIAANYGNMEFDFDKFSDMILEYAAEHNLETINFIGHSLGGTVAVALAVKAQEAGYRVPFIVADGSPGVSTDVKDWSGLIELGLPGKLCDTDQTGGYATRTTVELVQQLSRDFDTFKSRLAEGVAWTKALQESFHATFGERIARAWNQTTNKGLPNNVCMSQLQFLADHPITLYGDKLGRETSLLYICTAEPALDPTVDVWFAQNTYAREFKQLGRNFEIRTNREFGHANPQACPRQYNDIVADFAGQINLPDIRILQAMSISPHHT